MDESDIKSEVSLEHNANDEQNSSNNQNEENIQSAGIVPSTANTKSSTEGKPEVKRRKLKMEIELDYKLDNEYYFKSRERRKVVKYEDKPLTRLENVKKQKVLKSKQKKQIEHRKKLKNNDDEKQFICETCHLPFMTLAAFIGHRKKHLKDIIFKCALCSKEFESNAELLKHKIVHEKESRNFLCKKCKSAFTDHLEYLKHKVTHQFAQTYKCGECNKQYTQKTGFYIHIETHFNKSIVCDICHLKFRPSSFKAHRNSHGKEGYKCVECGKVCRDKSLHDYHMISHTGVKPYQCHYCGKGFSNSGQRQVHMRTHTGEKPSECKVCHQRFRQNTDMNRHMISHQTEKTVKCDVCGKKFFHKESLRDHMDIHNNTQKFKCPICGQRIHTRTGLKSHLMHHHSNERNFHCVPCGFSFKTHRSLKKHETLKKHINNLFGYNRKMKNEE